MNRASCRGCIYYRLFSTGGQKACHYLLDTNQKRGCPASKCTKKLTRQKVRQRTPAITKSTPKINMPIRLAIKQEGLFLYQVAEMLDMSVASFSRKLNRNNVNGYCYRFNDKEKARLSKTFNIPIEKIE